jgi:hypothetical protein
VSSVTTSTAAAQALAADLRGLLRAGLPVPDGPGLEGLLALRGVVARALEPGERASRLRALDGLLRWQLARFEHPRLAEAARLLFGATRETSGLTLTERRERAAAAAGYEAHHFRKRIEPEICDRLAAMLSTDAEDFRPRAAAPALGEPHTPIRLAADVFAWEAAEHEQALSTLWAGVYALRADLLATARLASMSGPGHPETERAAHAALWQWARLLNEASGYRDAYGPHLLGAHPHTSPEDLAKLAGWYPPLDEATTHALVAAAATDPRREGFLAAVAASPAAARLEAWCADLAAARTSRELESWT